MAKKQESQALAKWDEELAAAAAEAAEQEANTGGGQFFSTRGGILALSGAPIPGNKMGVVVLDSVLFNALYLDDYDPENPQSPTCYAFGRDEATIAPHEEAPEKAAEACGGCPNNVFGSADKGRGKVCKNGRRLALVSAGLIDPKTDVFEAFTDEADFAKGQVAFLNLAPTSINSFGAYVKQLFGTLKRPPFGVFTQVSVVPDPKTQFKVFFENLGPVPDDLIPAVLARHKEVRETIAFPFPKAEATVPQTKGRSAKVAAPARARKF
jgi:hypothetical protein